MQPAQLQAQANQAAAQGQQQIQSDLSQSAGYGANYGADTQAAQSANQNLQNYIQQMQGTYNPTTGTGNAGSAYNYELGQLGEPAVQSQLAQANQGLLGLSGALTGATNQFATPGGVGAYGMSAPAMAGYESSVLSPLQTGLGDQNQYISNLNTQQGNLLTGANQFTANTVQGQQNTMSGLNQVYQNAQNQSAQAMQQMQFYSQLASTQGGLDASQQQAYATAIQGYTTAQAAMIAAQAQASQAATAAKIAPSTIAEQEAQAAYYNPPKTSNGTPLNVSSTPVSSLMLGTNNGGLQGGNYNLQ